MILEVCSGKGGDVDRLEDLLAKAMSAESRARAELIEEKSSRQTESSSLSAALDAARKRGSDLQSRLANVEQENEKLLQEREVVFHHSYSSCKCKNKGRR